MKQIIVITNQYSLSKVVNPVIKNQNEFISKYVNISKVIYPNGRGKISSYLNVIIDLFKVRWDKLHYDTVYHVQFGGFISFISTMILGDRCVISFHGTDLHGGSPKTVMSKIKSKINCVLSLIASKRAGKVTVVSPSLVSYLPKPIQSEVTVIGTGTDVDLFKPINKDYCKTKLGLDLNKKYILFSDISYSPVKRRDIALSVIDELNRLSSSCYELLIMTKVPYDQVRLYLNSSECVLITSDLEGSPNIVKESVACNIPVVSVDVGDVRYQSEKFDSITVVDRDIENLACSILELKSSDYNYEKIRDEYSLENIAKKTVQLYASIS